MSKLLRTAVRPSARLLQGPARATRSASTFSRRSEAKSTCTGAGKHGLKQSKHPSIVVSSSSSSSSSSLKTATATFATSSVRRDNANDAANFWQCEPGTEDHYWAEYEKTRPTYSHSGFLDVIYDYHASKPGAKFDLCHDVAAGAGHGAIELARRFSHVVLSDESSISLGAARRRMAQDGIEEDRQTSFVACSGEQLADNAESGAADLVTVAESIPMMDEQATLASFARVLRPGGTAAIWFYGRPRFTEPQHRPTCQPLYDAIMDRLFSHAMQLGGPQMLPTWRMATNGINSWLDYIDVAKSGLWEKVERHRWNDRIAKEPGFYTENACAFPIEPVSAVDAATERLVAKEDHSFWTRQWGIADVRKYADFTFPNIDKFVRADDAIQSMFAELELAMGGPDAQRSYTIACALILATKK